MGTMTVDAKNSTFALHEGREEQQTRRAMHMGVVTSMFPTRHVNLVNLEVVVLVSVSGWL